jgi:uncharacterized protein YdaU (DUF1376 family)
MHLERQHHGSYLLLIMAAFKNAGWLPNDDGFLCTIAKCTPKEWKAERALYARFFDITDERWTHAKVTKEWEKAQEMTAQRSRAGKGSAAKRERDRLERERQRELNDRSTAVEIPLERDGQQTVKPLPSPSPDLTTTLSVSSSAQGTARDSELPEGWKPPEGDVAAVQRERPDIDPEFFERRQKDFRDWCASKAVTSFDWAATWRTFMRQTHAQPVARAAARTEAATPCREPLRLTGPQSIWSIRLASHRLDKVWPGTHGPAPESDQDNPNLDPDQRRQWRRYHGLPAEWRKDAA